MKPGERYMKARREAEAAHIAAGEPVKYRPSAWPADYQPVPGSNDDNGQRDYFGYLQADGMWMHMPAPGHHDEVGMSEWYVSQHPGSDRKPQRAPEAWEIMAQAMAEAREAERARPWWMFW